MTKKITLWLFCFFSIFCFAQNAKIDSLKRELKKDKADKFLDYKALILQLILVRNLPEYKKTVYELQNYALKTKKLDYIARSEAFVGTYFFFNSNTKKGFFIVEKALERAKKGKSNYAIAMIESNLGSMYYYVNNYKKAIFHLNNSVINLKKIPFNEEVRTSLFQNYSHQGTTFSFLGSEDLSTKAFINAKKYHNPKNINEGLLLKSAEINALEETKSYRKLVLKGKDFLKFLKKNKLDKDFIIDGYSALSNAYLELNQIDSSKIYCDSMGHKLKNHNSMEIKTIRNSYNFIKAKLFFITGRLDESKKIINKIILNKNNNIFLGDSYRIKGEINEMKKRQDLALENYEVAYKEFSNLGNKRKAVKMVFKIIQLYLKKNNSNKINTYLPIYTKLKDDIFNEQIAKSMTVAEIKYETELKEAKIKTQQLQIQKEQANKNIALSGIGFVLLLGFGGFWLYRNKQNQSHLKTQNTLLGLQQNLIEAELYSLNKQLDPHEIKNLLASISPEIQEKAPESYKKMLKLFNLTKASLNSNSITDSIENQLQQIDDFLSLEKSMLPIPLAYSIENNIENLQTQIPRLLLKNLVENAIKHGIKQQEIGGSIKVKVEERNNFIYISVDDTGKGRNHAISLDSGIGTTTYQKLFTTLNSKNNESATFEIIDKEQGTKVEVKIPTNYKYS
jgi:hypothetical protein